MNDEYGEEKSTDIGKMKTENVYPLLKVLDELSQLCVEEDEFLVQVVNKLFANDFPIFTDVPDD